MVHIGGVRVGEVGDSGSQGQQGLWALPKVFGPFVRSSAFCFGLTS